jgi:hypothetical protein
MKLAALARMACYEERGCSPVMLINDPSMKGLRPDPRLMDLLKRMRWEKGGGHR